MWCIGYAATFTIGVLSRHNVQHKAACRLITRTSWKNVGPRWTLLGNNFDLMMKAISRWVSGDLSLLDNESIDNEVPVLKPRDSPVNGGLPWEFPWDVWLRIPGDGILKSVAPLLVRSNTVLDGYIDPMIGALVPIEGVCGWPGSTQNTIKMRGDANKSHRCTVIRRQESNMQMDRDDCNQSESLRWFVWYEKVV